jgi:hypothetical protein
LTWVVIGMSPTSSRNSVPPPAFSMCPIFRDVAPVKAPRSWPKSSLSSRLSGSAAQLSATKGEFRRRLFWCRARATSSLPVPDSPVTSTVTSVGATWRSTRKTRCMASLRPMMLAKP